MRQIVAAIVAVVFAAGLVGPAPALAQTTSTPSKPTATKPAAKKPKVHHIALQISDNDAEKMNAVLNVAANTVRFYESRGQQLEVVVVAFNAGLNMLRSDKSPVLARLKTFQESMPQVTFDACDNTRQNMARAENKKPEEIPLVANAKIVPAGVVTLKELHDKGWFVIRP
jgi:hypothetical protein